MRLPSIPARGLPVALLLLGLLAPAGLTPLGAAPVPHPDRPDRLVETRNGLSVEYSPGQEAWMEMAFERMQAGAREPAATPSPLPSRDSPATTGSARDLRERRAALLAAVARQIGLPAATDLQGRAFDTFLGYYELMTELLQTAAAELPAVLTARHLAIWQRDELVRRLRAGAAIEGLSYDPATDSGRFDFNRNFETPVLKERFAAIHAAIKRQRLKHTFNYDKANASASFTLNAAPTAPKTPVSDATPSTATPVPAPDFVIPIIYRGEPATPDAAAFGNLDDILHAMAGALAVKTTTYRDATLVNIILHETAESGLLDKIITSPDRRWLCDGTANYVAWRVARDLLGPEFASQVYDLSAQLRLYAALQPKINLVRWSATENEKAGQPETDLGRAHYAFATRVMFLLTARHGENALAQLWADVARTPRKKVSAKTFGDAYRKRFKADLGQLIAAAEKDPIPAAVAAAVKSPATPTK